MGVCIMRYENEYGIWEISEGVEILIQPTQTWRDKNQKPEVKTQSKLREQAYKNLTKKQDGTSLILWGNSEITVDTANILFMNYFIEDNTNKSNELKILIKQAKNYIRTLYPDK
jgi:hypothetical protein